MKAFRKRTLLERIKYRFSKTYRDQRNAEMRAAIRELIEHPEMPCIIDNEFIPNGHGKP